MAEKFPVSPAVSGIHHVTAIAGDPQKNYNFYVLGLGLRFVKKTINFDDPQTFHLYYGDETGRPGSILTFFPWGERAYKGRRGIGQVTTISFLVPKNSLAYWQERLKELNIQFTGPFKRFNDDVILFEDHDGFELEILAADNIQNDGWDNGEIPAEHSIRGFHSVTLSLKEASKTEDILENILGFKKIAEEDNRLRYKADGDSGGNFVDILCIPGSAPGTMGVGAIHHIAWRTENSENQLKIRERIVKNDLSVTPVVDRNYFRSVYFREPENILFEIATDPPGFLIDEDKNNLGTHLKLPPWYEESRDEIEKALPPLITK
ncbi:MAG: ring-cleaving dioxygenase [Ignavibacteriaceae bacterium]